MDSFNKALAAEHSYFVNPIRGLMVWDADVRAEKRDLARHDRELGVKLQQALQEQPAEHTIACREAGGRGFCLRYMEAACATNSPLISFKLPSSNVMQTPSALRLAPPGAFIQHLVLCLFDAFYSCARSKMLLVYAAVLFVGGFLIW